MTISENDRFRGIDFVWLQSPPWHGVWTRQNHFARRLARAGARILYVENPPAFQTRLKAGLEQPPLIDVEPGITVMSLPLQVPGSRNSLLIGGLNGRRFAAAVRAQMKRMGMTNPIVWCRVPNSVHTLEHLSARAVVYDVTDDYEYYARSERERRLTRVLEGRLATRADHVFTTTLQLRDKLSAMTKASVTQVPNGVDGIFFERPGGEPPLAEVPHPRIGFVGLVASWMDFDLLERLGATWPGRVVVVGPVKPEVEARFSTIPGLVRHSAVPHMKVPEFLYSFDVCILPHEISELRHRSDPLKVVEYLATGLPIVSVALRSLEGMAPLVELATTSDEFIALVSKRIADPRPDLTEARRAFAATRNWDALHRTVADRLLALLGRTEEP